MSQTIFVILMLLGMVILPIVFKQWWLMFPFVTFGMIFGLFEGFATIISGRSVSQLFWAFSEASPLKAILILVGMALSWAALLIHLGSHLFKK